MILLVCAMIALTLSTILACIWPKSNPDDIPAMGLFIGSNGILALLIWIYCIIWWFIQDIFKVLTYFILEKYNLFGINNTRGTSEQTTEEAIQASRASRASQRALRESQEQSFKRLRPQSFSSNNVNINGEIASPLHRQNSGHGSSTTPTTLSGAGAGGGAGGGGILGGMRQSLDKTVRLIESAVMDDIETVEDTKKPLLGDLESQF